MKQINGNEFKNLTGYYLVDFNATWCGPCRALHPVLEELEGESTIPFYGVDVDDEGELAESLGIQSIPCIIIFKDGQEVSRSIGYKGKPLLKDFINNSIN
ncbi:MAG: thioredoxin fold domain-containing protein [Acholeplasmatales bacterium]|nr:thioredoxin fold domain-containing protein [Acholeplasmatales bacterium]